MAPDQNRNCHKKLAFKLKSKDFKPKFEIDDGNVNWYCRVYSYLGIPTPYLNLLN